MLPSLCALGHFHIFTPLLVKVVEQGSKLHVSISDSFEHTTNMFCCCILLGMFLMFEWDFYASKERRDVE